MATSFTFTEHDVQEEFQREREDMLDTIRQLSRQLKLKELLMNNFVPPEEERKLERHATWNDEEDVWVITGVEFSGNRRRPKSSHRPLPLTGVCYFTYAAGASSSLTGRVPCSLR